MQRVKLLDVSVNLFDCYLALIVSVYHSEN
jgi:hypothetical protein